MLTGLSGGGKTALSRLVAEALGEPYCVVAVKPNWTDSRDLLGFFNPISQTYVRTDALNFLLQARKEYETEKETARRYHLCLDEMNLARVEYYFAELLSAMERPDRSISLHDQADSTVPHSLLLTPNVIIVGTVNIDESVQPFSDKVKDRANTIAVPVDIERYVEILQSAQPPHGSSIKQRAFAFGKTRDGHKALEVLKDLHRLLSTQQLHFGYRTMDEVLAYLSENQNSGLLSFADGLDLQVEQRIFPKLRGRGDAFQRFLTCSDGQCAHCLICSCQKVGLLGSAGRIQRMSDVLKETGSRLMTLRINGEDVAIVDRILRDPPTLTEELTDKFEFRAIETKPELFVDGCPLPAVRDIDNPEIVRWEWKKGPLGRVGLVRLDLRLGGSTVAVGLLRVDPRKLTLEDYRTILDDIAELAYHIVYDLRESTFEHLDLVEPAALPRSGIEWLEKIVGILGTLENVLHEIDRQPHVRLASRQEDRFIWEVRNPGEAAMQCLAATEARGFIPHEHKQFGVISSYLRGGMPVRLPDESHDIDTNCYENQIIAQFLGSIEEKLRALRAQATRTREQHIVTQSLRALESLRALPFLKNVRLLQHPPRPSLVLLRNFRYRRFYELFRQFNCALRIRYGTPDQTDFLRLTTQQVFETYQAWVFFNIVEGTRIATNGRARGASTIVTALRFEELLVRLDEGSQIEIETQTGESVLITYQPSFSRGIAKPYSVSLPKRPDVTVELKGGDSAIVFDAKYRLDSEVPEEKAAGIGEPEEEDINKMHVYRDSLRIGQDKRFAPAAYIVYPGRTPKLYDEGRLGAIPMRPGISLDLLVSVIRQGLLID